MLGKHQNIAMCSTFDLVKSSLLCAGPPAVCMLCKCNYLLEIQEVDIICEFFRL